jgi:hypothetical protein
MELSLFIFTFVFNSDCVKTNWHFIEEFLGMKAGDDSSVIL